MLGPSSGGLQNFLEWEGNNIELLFYWTISQMMFVALGVFIIIGVNYFNGGLYRYENTIPYYEVVWTSLPTLILCSVAIPSISLLYTHEQEANSLLTINCTGHQWYWSYEYSNLEEVEFDSFITPTESLELGETRYLETDNRVVLPALTPVNFLITSEDVIHAWTVPVLSTNVDATPGRLSLLSLTPQICGVFYGQCSELCGANHSFMPIVIETTAPALFKEWLTSW